MENKDRAKKILFGNKNLPDNPEAKMNEEALNRHRIKKFSMYENQPPSVTSDGITAYPDSQALENITRKLNDAGVPVTNPDEGDEFVTDKYGDIFLAGDVDLIDGIAFDCQTGQRKSVLIVATVDSWYVKVEACCKEQGITPALALQRAIDYPDLARMLINNQQMLLGYTGVSKYCQEQGITPLDLIEQHSYFAKMNHAMLAEAIEKARKK